MSRKKTLYDVLSAHLTPELLTVDDESNQHSRQGIETHFTVVAVSSQFETLTLIARHRLVNEWVGHEFKTGMHALSLHLYTPEEWAKRPHSPATPSCHHGKESI